MGSLVGEQYIAPARQKDNAMTTDVLCPIFMVVADAIYCASTIIRYFGTPPYSKTPSSHPSYRKRPLRHTFLLTPQSIVKYG